MLRKRLKTKEINYKKEKGSGWFNKSLCSLLGKGKNKIFID